jgi:protein-disulfide isomerase
MEKTSFMAWILGIVFLAGVGVMGYQMLHKDGNAEIADLKDFPESVQKAQKDIALHYTGTRVIGQESAPVTIINVSSLSCPHCADFFKDILPQIKKDYVDTGKIKLAIREVAADQSSMMALSLVTCAAPEKYDEAVMLLYQNQRDWLMSHEPRVKLKGYAEQLGLSEQDFEACMANSDLKDKVSKTTFGTLKELNIVHTPTLIVQGTDKRLEGTKSYDTFKRFLDEGIAGEKKE